MSATETYNGWTNWGTWHLNLVLTNSEWLHELTQEWGEHLASLPYDPSWVEFARGVDYLKERVMELAERERTEGWGQLWLNETLQEEGIRHIDWDELARCYRDAYLELNPPQPMTVWLNRDLEDGTASWMVEVDGEFAEFLEVPLEECGDLDIHSSTLLRSLEDAGYPMEHRHWHYKDSDFGPIGEWNRPEDEGSR